MLHRVTVARYLSSDEKINQSPVDMEEVTEEIYVPSFTRRKNGNGSHTSLLRGLFDVALYPDGDEPGNEGYLTVVLDYGDTSNPDVFRRSLMPYRFTASVVDAEGTPRFPQSFVAEVGECWAEDCPPATRLEKFFCRRFLLDNREELLPDDTLTLRFEAVCVLEDAQVEDMHAEHELRRLHETARVESWFIREEETNVVDSYQLDLRDPDSPLCTRLREKSEFFEALFQMPSKREEDGCVPITDVQFEAFFNMLGYVRFGQLRHVRFDGQYCDLYSVADRYGVIELQEICSGHLQRHLAPELALSVLWMACDDADLGAAAFRVALDHWSDVREDFEELLTGDRSSVPASVRELACAAKMVNRGTCDTLLDLAARLVLAKTEELRRSPAWSVFEREMPNLARVISDEYKPVETYQEHALSYDFYT